MALALAWPAGLKLSWTIKIRVQSVGRSSELFLAPLASSRAGARRCVSTSGPSAVQPTTAAHDSSQRRYLMIPRHEFESPIVGRVDQMAHVIFEFARWLPRCSGPATWRPRAEWVHSEEMVPPEA
ncbi:hypothetical protein ANO11243_026580 [Dothideomycetidae sp. 11243]|nr:hypothetical protein ANO11243_026580 [fungal sp. No.11243]